MFVVQAGVEQTVAKRKEDPADEGRQHQTWSGPVDMWHCRGNLGLGRSRYGVGEIYVYNVASRADGARRIRENRDFLSSLSASSAEVAANLNSVVSVGLSLIMGAKL